MCARGIQLTGGGNEREAKTKTIPVSKAAYSNLMALDLGCALAAVLGVCEVLAEPPVQAQRRRTRQETLKKVKSWAGRCRVYFKTPVRSLMPPQRVPPSLWLLQDPQQPGACEPLSGDVFPGECGCAEL